MRLVVAVTCVCLGACARPPEPPATTDLNSNPSYIEMKGEAQQTTEREERERCAKINELKIGMTTSQVLLTCAGRPLRDSKVITRGGKMEMTWAYRDSYLHFVDGKLSNIKRLQ